MNARDFCFWLQGFMELTGGAIPTKAAWKLILEHLELAKQHEGKSREEFEGVVSMLSGFTSIAGNEKPTDEQYTRIADAVQGVFVKVTSDLDDDNEPEDDNSNWAEAIKKTLEEAQKTQPYSPPPPYMPYPNQPWKEDRAPSIPSIPSIPNDPWVFPPTVICKATDEQVFCAQMPSTSDVACASLDDAIGAGGMYEAGVNIADSRLG